MLNMLTAPHVSTRWVACRYRCNPHPRRSALVGVHALALDAGVVGGAARNMPATSVSPPSTAADCVSTAFRRHAYARCTATELRIARTRAEHTVSHVFQTTSRQCVGT